MPVLVLVLLIALRLLLTADRQHPVGKRHIDVLLIDTGQFRRQVDCVLALGNIDLWRQHAGTEPRKRGTAREVLERLLSLAEQRTERVIVAPKERRKIRSSH